MSKTISHSRTLAEAIILQAIDDLWDRVRRRASMRFFDGDGFVLYSEIAGIGYIKQLSMLRMLAKSAPKTGSNNTRKVL